VIYLNENAYFDECKRVITGTLKWYSPDKKFGFIVDDETGVDVRLGAKELRDYGWDTVADGSWIKASVLETARGLQVAELFDVVAPSTLDASKVFGFDGLSYLAEGFVPARVIWYNADKGYGFASTFGDARQCFLHWSALAEIGLMSIAPGTTIAVRIGRSTRGRVAASIRSLHQKAEDSLEVIEAPCSVAA